MHHNNQNENLQSIDKVYLFVHRTGYVDSRKSILKTHNCHISNPQLLTVAALEKTVLELKCEGNCVFEL